ncbi:hypothetical protein [Micromonospora inyonensis]|uniref:hypothetical protein n=1 Tax=Micromonospora inyonensis TaxID=47866 RepID=UPI00159EFC77|nr:hypothetical protein [Micromonospora inyonensis]
MFAEVLGLLPVVDLVVRAAVLAGVLEGMWSPSRLGVPQPTDESIVAPLRADVKVPTLVEINTDQTMKRSPFHYRVGGDRLSMRGT